MPEPYLEAIAMKVCYVLEACSAGAGRYAIDLVSGMASRGHEVHLIYSPLRADAHFKAELASCRTVRTHAVPIHRRPHPSDLTAIARMIRYLRQHGPFQIVHGVSSKGGAVARLAGAFMTSGMTSGVFYTPQAFVTMSPTLGAGGRVVFAGIERLLAKLTSAVVAVSEAERRHGRWLGIPESKIVYIPNGAEPLAPADRAAVRAALGIADDTVVIGFIGRLEEQKAPQLLVEAIGLLPADLPDYRVVIIGSGSKQAELHRMAARGGVDGRIRWLGPVKGRDYLAAFDIFALTSDYEGFPYVFLEALQAGLPIVTTPVGGADEAVVHLENGIVVPRRDARTLAASLVHLIRDPQSRQRMGQSSRLRAALFEVSVMLQRHEDSYRRALGETIPQQAGKAAAATMAPSEWPLDAAGVRSRMRA